MAQRSRFSDPANPMHSAAVVTPSDTADLPGGVTRGIYVGTPAGSLRVNLADDSTAVVFNVLAIGVIHHLAVKRVFATGTTATTIVALY